MRPKEFDGVYWELLLRLATTLCVQENFSTTPGRSSSLSPVLLKITHVRTETVTNRVIHGKLFSDRYLLPMTVYCFSSVCCSLSRSLSLGNRSM